MRVHSMRMRRILFLGLIGFASLAISTVVVFVIAEVLVRSYVAKYQIQPSAFRQQVQSVNDMPKELFLPRKAPYGKLAPQVSVHLKTNDYEVDYYTNTFGYRDAEWSVEPPTDKTRIMVLGDSYTFGEGVQYGERYTEHLEQSLPQVELLNTGLPGFGLDEMLLFYQNEGWRYKPQIVMVAINWVDFERNYLGLYRNGKVETEPFNAKTAGKFGRTLLIGRHSEGLFTELPFARQSTLIGLLDRVLLEKQLLQDAHTFELRRYLLPKSKTPKVETKAEIQQRGLAFLQQLASDAESHAAQLVVIVIEPNESFEFLTAGLANVKVINLQPKLLKLSNQQMLAFSIDPHFNATTHKQIAEWLVAELQPLVASTAANQNSVR